MPPTGQDWPKLVKLIIWCIANTVCSWIMAAIVLLGSHSLTGADGYGWVLILGEMLVFALILIFHYSTFRLLPGYVKRVGMVLQVGLAIGLVFAVVSPISPTEISGRRATSQDLATSQVSQVGQALNTIIGASQ